MDPRFIVGVLGNVFAFFMFLAPLYVSFMFLAPLVTFKKIIKNNSIGHFSVLPYAMTLLNNLLSAWISGIGAVIESAYILVFLIFAPEEEKLKIVGLLALILSIFAGVAYVSRYALDNNERKIFCGIAASVSSIIMYGSPLSVMMSVIRNESVEYMPFLLSLFSFLCGTSWFIFGLLGRDPFLTVPNGIGCALGAMQLILYFIYYDNNGQL